MSVSEQDELAGELARHIVSRLAPGELAEFDAAREEFLARSAGAGGSDPASAPSPTEQGPARAGMTPVALVVASEVAQFLIGEIMKAVKQEAATVIGGAVRTLLRRLRASLGSKRREPAEPVHERPDADSPTPLELGPERLSEIRALAYERAVGLDLAEADAARLADIVTEALASTPP